VKLAFRWLAEDLPGAGWQALLQRSWPSYRRWFSIGGERARPALRTSRSKLREHLPELLPVWERLCELAGGDEEVARMLSLYRPAPYIAGCSQAVWLRGEPLLVRNYDFHPAQCEGVFLASRWGGTRVLASSDCLWGALDGLNEHGLAVALAFGGRPVVGDGFGIPLLVRYLLENAHDVAEATRLMGRLPCHMSYNLTLLDAAGAHALIQVAPDRPMRVLDKAAATNHQRKGEWARYEAFSHSVDRESFLLQKLRQRRLDAEGFVGMFLEAPLFQKRYARAFGTLYTVVYRPRSRTVEHLWPGARVESGFDRFENRELVVGFQS